VGALLTTAGATNAQDNILRVEFEGDSARRAEVGMFRKGRVLYVSLTDLAQTLSLSTYENTRARKLEIKQLPYRIKVSAGNPFVVITDQQGRQTVSQVPFDVVYAVGSYFVPLEPFVPVLGRILNLPAAYDRPRGILRIGRPPPAALYDISTLSIEQKANGTLVRLHADRPLEEYENWLRSDGWLYVTVADARADIAAIKSVRPAGAVRQIVAIQSPTSVQLTFRLAGKVSSTELIRDPGSHDLLLTIHTPQSLPAKPPPETKPAAGKKAVKERDGATGARGAVETKPPAARTAGQETRGPGETRTEAESAAPVERPARDLHSGLESQRDRWKLDVIVIDAGHGGYDPGTIGVTGVKEKDVTLGIALKLGKLITNGLKDVRVVHTRTGDRFVELYRRGQIANEAGGKLFVSIHANSLPRKPSPTRGFEVYLLRPGRTEEAIEIAERENAVIQLEEGYEDRYQEITEENFILVAMAQSAHMRSSEQFADLTQQELGRHTGLPNRGVKQAGFFVLVGAAMPNVLIETGYLSNRQDERFLRTSAGQQKIADSIFRAIRKYKEEYEKLLLEGRDLGDRR
jgi:N-acetylmuramoyl-L-alanine amidase